MTSIRQASLFLVGLVVLANAQENLRRLQGERISFLDAIALTDGPGGGGGPPKAGQDGLLGNVGPEGGRIIGGQDVQPGELPFYGNFEGEVMCGGALIHDDIFLTAAHCLEKGFPASIRIGATTTISQNEGESVNVCSGIIHPANNMKSMENDIAILKLCDSVFVNSYAEYNRNPNYPSATGTDLFMVGFGRTSVDSSLSPILQKAKVDYLDNIACSGRYNKYNGDQTMCADSPTAGICYGDSGGPFLDVNNKVVGLNSYIVDTCASDYPDFFTRVSSYASWIDDLVCTQAISPPEWCRSGAQADDDFTENDDEAGGNPTDPITECFTLLVGFFQSLLGGR